MNKVIVKLRLLLFCFILFGCSGNSIIKPMAIADAESLTEEGLKNFSEASWQRAQQLFTKALSLYQGLDDQQGILRSQINLAEVALVLKEYIAGYKHLQIASQIANKTLQIDIQARIKLLFSQYALAQNRLSLAKEYLQPLLLTFEGEQSVASASYIQLVAVANRTKIAFVEKSQRLLWLRRFSNALQLTSNNDLKLNARLLRFQADLLQEQGKADVAESNLHQALAHYKKSFFRPGIAVTLTELGHLYEAEGRWLDAKAYFNRALAVYHFLKDSEKVSLLTKVLLKVESQIKPARGVE